MRGLLQYLVFPGLLWTLTVAALIAGAAGSSSRYRRGIRGLRGALGGGGPAAHALSALLALLALALLPWPAPPGALRPSSDLWHVWALAEASFLAALVPGLAGRSPAAGRATVRTAQLGVLGRAALWAAIGIAAAGRVEGWPGLVPLLAGAAAALLALPVAAGWPPFGASGLGVDDQAAQLPGDAAELARLAADLRGALLVTAVAVWFVQAPQLVWWQQLGLKLWLALALALLGRGLRGTAVSRTLPAALRYCMLVVVPVAVLALVARAWPVGG